MLCIEKILVCLQDNLGGENDFMLATRISKKKRQRLLGKSFPSLVGGGGWSQEGY
jgi:hypothetical protein